ncbi:PLP-dependent aminotransferase family protein [Roseococcus sp. XZZS9]|uniref:PLP-dependent aminotransferase family protein n=2 Tax=Roseococcus pinisoli TaxID=2835040 RepID=A0ABS5QER4_9PROT|nr:PLP-dependent aminotransferase family protein [Roseococcus pinisoli]
MSVWMPDIAGRGGPIYLAVVDAMAAAIAEGALRPGDRLPTHRALAEALGVDLTTITRAYAEARRRGLLEATVGRGTFVRSAAPLSRPQEAGPVDLAMNLPPVPADLRGRLQRDFARVIGQADPSTLLTYRSGAGTLEERAAGAAWVRPSLGEVDPARLVLSPGAQPALLATLGLLAEPGELILADQLTYPGLRSAAGQRGLRLLGLPSDEHGLDPEALAAACRDHRPKALYCVPTMHNPAAITMPVERRQAIASILREQGLMLIEDDAYGLLPTDPIPALAHFVPERALHIATLSKVLSPALRLAYVTAPDVAMAGRIATALRANVLMASPLLTGLVTSWHEDGTSGAILGSIRAEATARQSLARGILPASLVQAHPEGLHLWLRLPAPWDRRDFIAHLRRERGLAVVPSDAFSVGPAPAPEAVRLALGAAPTREALRHALHSIAAALQGVAPLSYSEIV